MKSGNAGAGADDEDGNDDDDDDDELPFACFICRKPWDELSTAVITQCKHYFCEPCAITYVHVP